MHDACMSPGARLALASWRLAQPWHLHGAWRTPGARQARAWRLYGALEARLKRT